ncbi:MAG: hypothetical protein JSV88_21750 [Candidatus Aminicenantes bacterium]|nr:MAG: hypothetical protein JSV88_21750 [Candidatus Aminicenantes bacterium]
MKKNILILISVVLMITGYVFAEVTVIFDSSYSDVDTSVLKNSYIEIFPNLTFAEADSIAQDVFAYTGTSLFLDEHHGTANNLIYRNNDNSARFQINQVTGDIFYQEYIESDGDTPGLPPKNKALSLAKKHLKALGLFKDKMHFNGVNTVKEDVVNGQTGQTIGSYNKQRIVSFSRKLGGIPVAGASRVVVILGRNGELAGLTVRWMDVESVKIPGVIKSSEIKNHLKDKLKVKHKNSDSVLVKKSDLVLYDDGKGVIEPVLLLQGELTNNGVSFAYNWIIPVLTEPKADYPGN